MDFNQSNMAFKSSSSTSHPHNFMQVQNPQSTYDMNDKENMQQKRARMQQITNQHLAYFWRERVWEMENMADPKQHMLPLARIKKVMKSDDEVKMISADSPMLFAKAAELFIMELTLRSWMHTETGKRRTLQRADVANAICDSQVFDFLLDVVPVEEDEEDEAAAGNEGQAMPPNHAAIPPNFTAMPPNLTAMPLNFTAMPPNLTATPLNFTAMPPNLTATPPNLTFYPTLGAQLVQQQHNSVDQVTERNGGWTAPLLPSGLNFPVLSPHQFPLTPNPPEELMGQNVGGESSQRSAGMYFPSMDDNRYHFNYNPVTDEEMVARPSAEIQSARPGGAYLGMLGLNNFNFPQNFHP